MAETGGGNCRNPGDFGGCLMFFVLAVVIGGAILFLLHWVGQLFER